MKSPAEIIARVIDDNLPSFADLNRIGNDAIKALAEAGYRIVPSVPTEVQWSGLARQLVMWRDLCHGHPTGQTLYQHLSRIGYAVPDWLRREIPDTNHVPPKGTVAVCIYLAMLDAAEEASE